MLSIAVFFFLLKEYNCFSVLPHDNFNFVLPPTGTFEGKLSVFNKETDSKKCFRPVSWDWRDEGKVSPVKNQGQCGASWAFSVVANIESQLMIHKKQTETLSEQFLIDCDEAQQGCNSGSILATFGHVVASFGGVLRDKDYYPYVEEPGQCRWKHDTQENLQKHPTPVPVTGFQKVPSDEEVMAQFVYERGPLSAAINSASMKRYKGDIDEPTVENCNPDELDHAVLIVGYNVYVSETGKETPYWIIKNSWGEDWGDKGYYYLASGRNACGIASDVSIAYV
ncbi:hypothetical protein PYW07_016749 [Mythimna separata]|uniref:Peptidase C1A papain C-terminal domain-containing protein n=1 Tax=Mythimna separata TaxID=271217 RepID=A0AAD8DT77_MYTSE|nr:hypothetical protein PYW07_016749 [Mythimna separata]